MIQPNKIVKNSDSLITLLAAQCVDLESLLALAREETTAAQQGNFENILEIVTRRAEICDRLETFQQQIAELRQNMEASGVAVPIDNGISNKIVEIANLTIVQDQKTKLLLTDARTNAAAELAILEKSQRGTNAYLREETRGLSCNRNF